MKEESFLKKFFHAHCQKTQLAFKCIKLKRITLSTGVVWSLSFVYKYVLTAQLQ